MNAGLSVIVPAFNEAATLEDVVRRIDGVLTTIGGSGEIIVVDDGSSDATGTIADRLQQELPRVKAMHHPHNGGYGAAQRTGVRAASETLVCVLPADGQVPPEELAKYVAAADQADVVVGRYRTRPDAAARRVFSRVYVGVLRTLFGVRLSNVNAPKLYRREHLRNVDITARGGFADAQIVIQLHQQGRRFVEVDIECVPRTAGQSSVGTFAAFQALWELVDFYRRRRQ